MIFSRRVVVLLIAGLLSLSAPVAAQNNPTDEPKLSPDEVARQLDAAIETLIAEANELDVLEKPETTPKFSQPHPAVQKFGSEFAIPALDRMLGKFTDNEHRDIYIRFHLLWVADQASAEDRVATGERLLRLIKQMPGPLEVPGQPERVYEPVEVYNEWRRARSQATITIGYPPMLREIGPPESFQHMPPEQRAAAEKAYQRSEELRSQWTLTTNPEARAFNQRIRQLNKLIRQYRGQLTYAVLKTGDPAMLDLVLTEIDRSARAGNGIAFDLMAYMYLASFDGVLQAYPTDVLRKASDQLERTARATEGWVEFDGRMRNFADYAFHMIHVLREPGGLVNADTELPTEVVPRSQRVR